MTTDVLFNLALTAIELSAWSLGLRRVPSVDRVALLVLAQPAVAAALSVAFGEDPFGILRLFAYGVFIHVPLLWVAIGARLAPAFRRLCIALSAIVVLIGVDAFLIEPQALEVNRIQLRSPKLSRALRIAVLSDLQMEEFGSYERAALRRALAERPDLILLPGDYIQVESPERHRAVSRELAAYLRSIRFSAPLGVFAVEGNVDPPDWTQIFEPIGATTFRDTGSQITGELQITGLTLGDSFDRRLHIARSDRFHIVFGHAPDFALGDVDADLLVAGHTHGGQVRLPVFGPPITLSRVPRAWAAGTTSLSGGRTLVVSRGIGLERGYAPPLRFLCRPEIVILELSGA